MVQIHETPSSKSVNDAVSTLQTTTIGTESEDEWKTFTKTIDTLENPVFAIDKTGVVIIWNKAMEQLTGVPSKEMVGKGNREYAIPFFGEPRPMLVDYIVISTDKRQSGKFPGIKRVGNTFIGEMEKVKIREKPMFLWGKGTAVHDEQRCVDCGNRNNYGRRATAGSSNTGRFGKGDIYRGDIKSYTQSRRRERERGNCGSHPFTTKGLWNLCNKPAVVCYSKSRF